MKMLIRSFALLSSTCLLVAAGPADRELPGVNDEPAPGQAEDADPAELRAKMEATHRRFSNAYNRRDAQALARLYAEDAIFVNAEGRQLRGRREIATYWEESFAQMPSRIELEVVEAGGRGDLGWEYGTFSVEVTTARTGEQPQTMQGYYVALADIADGQARIKVHVAHPGPTPMLSPEPEPPTPPGAGPSRAPETPRRPD